MVGVTWSTGATQVSYPGPSGVPTWTVSSPTPTPMQAPYPGHTPVTWPQPLVSPAAPWMTPTPMPASEVCLSPGSEPVPQKIVNKVLAGSYVDMKELLGDNISLLQQLEGLNTMPTLPALPGSMKPRLREITSLALWLYCFWLMLPCDAQTSSPGIGSCMRAS